MEVREITRKRSLRILETIMSELYGLVIILPLTLPFFGICLFIRKSLEHLVMIIQVFSVSWLVLLLILGFLLIIHSKLEKRVDEDGR